jgi:light-regulated signal transduction histidine kinase (bacteriophytochrome)
VQQIAPLSDCASLERAPYASRCPYWPALLVLAVGVAATAWVAQVGLDRGTNPSRFGAILFAGLTLSGVVGVYLGVLLSRKAILERQVSEGIWQLRASRLNSEKKAQELADATAELLRKNADLDEFTYAASHDLQEPLRRLISFSSILKDDLGNDLPERAQEDLGYIVDSARRMQTLVQDLLSLAGAGNQPLSTEPVSLDLCAETALASLSARIEETGAEILRDGLPTVLGDRTLLTQVYQNLIGNALKLRHREVRPVVRLGVERLDGHFVLSVSDNGIGIKPDYVDQIFAPFKRLHGRGEYEGSGIGLAICSKAVARHGGDIWVDSKPGDGSTFRFTLASDIQR